MANNSIKYDFAKGAVIMEDGDDYKEVSCGVASYTISGGTGAEDGAGTWAKLATLDIGSGNYNNISLTFELVAVELNTAPLVTVGATARQSTAGLNPESRVEVFAASGQGINGDSFRLVGGTTNGDPITLWMRKDSTYTKFFLHERALSSDSESPQPVTYHREATWQSTAPTGTVVVNSQWAGTPWVTLSLQNGWSVGFGDGLRYRRSADGSVDIEGYIEAGTYGAAVNVDALPVGYRPGRILRFANATGDASTPGLARTYVSPDGLIYCTAVSGSSGAVAFKMQYMAEN